MGSAQSFASCNDTVTVIIPCRNESLWMRKCLESIESNDFPKECLEVLVVDGLSDDGTRSVVEEFIALRPWVRMLDNPRKTAPAALNVGIGAARGDVIMRMDAHSEYPPDYISKLVLWLKKSGVDNVGGVVVTQPASDTPMAKAIALGCSHPFGVGNALFRIGVSEPREVDTVPFGCYRRDVFTRIGLFDEELVRNQDNEFNQRLCAAGGKTLLIPDVVSRYRARGTLGKLWQTYFQYGYFNALVARKAVGGFALRHAIPSLFVMGLWGSALAAFWFVWALWLFVGIATAYLIPLVTFSMLTGVRHGLRIGLRIALVFATLHFSKGIGMIGGIWDFWILRRNVQVADAGNVPLSR